MPSRATSYYIRYGRIFRVGNVINQKSAPPKVGRLWKLCQIGIAAASIVLMLAAACEEEKMVDCGHIGEQKESTCEWWQDRIQWED